MIAAVDMDRITLDPPYQPPAIMQEIRSAPAFFPQADIFVPETMPSWLIKKTFGDHGDVASESSAGDHGDVASESSATLANIVVNNADPRYLVKTELSNKARQSKENLNAYLERIESLRSKAADDNFALNATSERDFLRFIKSEPFLRKGALVLMDNGNLRAIWKGDQGAHLGLQFLGSQLIQYVIFKRRNLVGPISRVTGRDNFNGIKLQIQAFDLRPLMFE